MAGRWWYTDSAGKRKRTAAGRKHDYEAFQSSEEAKKDRASRNSARRSALKKGLVKLHDRRDVHHLHSVRDNSQTKVLPRSVNRGIHEASRKRGSKRRVR